MKKREVDLVVISDVHLGTYGCHALELLKYLKSIKPGKIVLNGDIIDIWQFSKNYWPKAHTQVIRHIIGLIGKGVPIYYVTGNHDELLRKFTGFQMGSLKIVNKVSFKLDGKKAWLFHGDVFDVTMQNAKWLAKLGAIGYDTLILINRFVNFISERMLGKGKLSLSKRIKDSVKSAGKFIQTFEQTAAEIAISNKYAYVICGHIHQPSIKEISNHEGSVTYLNSGDWVENLTSLEYHQGEWRIYRYQDDPVAPNIQVKERKKESMSTNELFNDLVQQFNFLKV